MKSLAPITRRRLILTSTLAATALLATLLPWQVVAQTSPPTAARGNSAAPSTAPTASPNPAAPAAKAPTPPEPGLFGAQEEPPTQFLQQTSYASRVSAPVVDIVPAMDGTLQEIAVKEGDHVKKGQLLFRFDAHDAEIALRLQQLAVDRAKMQVAVPEGVASKSEIDQAKSRLQTEQIILEARAHEVAMASVLAPIDGVVSSINLTPGQFIPKGQHLTRVVDLSSMSLFTSIPSEALAKVKVGQKISFHLMNSDHVYPAQITYIAPMLDDNFAVEAKAAFTVPADDLRPGMIGSASIDSK
jgi:RND family efflux transporter MFP subunit